MAELCVIFNPAAGKNRAEQRLQPLRQSWGAHVAFRATEHVGHAVELARNAALEGFDIVAAAGGDGTVHEVANGILQAGRPEVKFAVYPIGSANDYAHSLRHDTSAPSSAHETPRVDVGIVRSAGRQSYFVCCLGLGLNGAVTYESRKIDWLQGTALYGLATLRALHHHYACPAMQIAIDDQPAHAAPTLMLSVLLGRREGGFVLAPDAKLDDGLFDYVHSGKLSRFAVLGLLPRLALFGPPKRHPQVRQGQCRRIRLNSPEPLMVHIDGEFFALPDDGIREIDIEIVPAALAIHDLGK